MAKKKLCEFVSILDAADKVSNIPVPKTLLERFEEEIDWLGESMNENRYLAAIAAKDYIEAAESQHYMMILQYHRKFIFEVKAAITNDSLDALVAKILNFIMYPSMSSDRPRAYELAKLDAYREEWKLVTKILKARDKEAIASQGVA